MPELDCICGDDDRVILRRIQDQDFPSYVLKNTCCWSRICRVQAKYSGRLAPGVWSEVCRLRVYSPRPPTVEDEAAQLRQELLQSESPVLGEIMDEELKERLEPLFRHESLPLDTIVREASVLLEHRLRQLTGAGDTLSGVQLVDATLQPSRCAIRFSDHDGEQDGARFLYRGAMQFIRNPPMHRLVTYPEATARALVRLTDCLLVLLSQAAGQST